MNALVPLPRAGAPSAVPTLDALPALIDRAAAALAAARSSAEVLEAHELADSAYGAAKEASRLLRAKGAHDALVAAALQAQGDALMIQAQAKIRLADEYDAARARGEMAGRGKRRNQNVDADHIICTLAEVGLKREEIYAARKFRDAEAKQPGFVREIVEARLREGLEPSRKAVLSGARRLLSFDSEADLDAHVKHRRAEKQALKAERRDAREVALGNRTRAAAAELGTKLYGVIYADPPWPYDVWSPETGMDRAAANHYPVMTFDAIKALVLPAARDCALYLWVPNPLLLASRDVLDAWDFTYCTNYVWVKDRIGLGYRNRGQHELLLLATRGEVPAAKASDRSPSVITAPRGAHSAKPLEAVHMIEREYPTWPKVELFARGPRDGWDVWGNQADGGDA